ncbi:class I SAM-dependent RNA methyltransferase [Georgenia alba]|uniref:Class I SAM-dependent RNA methyltransferase n=1 Tax=Georgenia alba TaxID=2233858 RepID=A0ABW2Q9H6_9MICO
MTGEDAVLDVGPPAHGGHCVARLEGRVVFVRHALPGERVRVRVTDRRSRFWRADAVEVLQASPDRVPSVWPEAGPGGVGGGELAHVALDAQRAWKRQVVADTLRRIGGPDVAEQVADLAGQGQDVPPVEAVGADAQTDGLRTRTRIELTVDADGRAGMHRHRSHEVVALEEMPLAHEDIAALDLLGDGSAWRRTWRPGARVEAIAPSAGPPLVLLDGEPATRGRRRSTGPPRRTVREVVPTAVGELSYRVSGSGFWQVHRAGPATLVGAVLDGAGTGLEGARVLELYSGAGLLTLPLAMAVGDSGAVASLEGSDRAVRDARRNLHQYPNALLGAAHVTGDSVREAAGTGDLASGVDLVVLDPPRAGAGREVMEAVTALRPARVVLVACDPAALARDLAAARAGGYVVASLRGLDLFPHTHHVEVVATLTR